MKPVNLQLSERIKQLVKAEEGMCARSVARAFTYHREALPEDALYVEGVWMVEGQTGIHVWIETRDKIIDPTYATLPGYARADVQHRRVMSCNWDGAPSKHYRNQPIDSDGHLEVMPILEEDELEVETAYWEMEGLPKLS